MVIKFLSRNRMRGALNDKNIFTSVMTDTVFEDEANENTYKFNGTVWQFFGDGKMTSGDTKPTNVVTGSTILETDTLKTFDYNGSAWVERSGGGAEFHTITTTETYEPDKQNGLMHVVFNKDGVNTGTVKYYLDGVLQDTYDGTTAAGQYNQLVDPTTSIQFVGAAGTWAGTQYNGNTGASSGYGIISNLNGATMSPDGNYMIISGDRRMLLLTLPTPYDMTSIGSYTAYDTQSYGSVYPYSVQYGNSGTYVYAGMNNGSMYRLTTDNGAYQWTSNQCGTNGQRQIVSMSSLASTSGAIFGMNVSTDGTKVFCNFQTTGTNIIYEFDLSTAYDLTSAAYNGNNYDTTMSSSYMRAFTIDSTGTWLYTTDRFGSTGAETSLYRHEMSTPYDITTATIDPTSINISTVTGYSTKLLNQGFFVTNDNSYIGVGAQQASGSEEKFMLELQTVFSANFEIATS